MGEKNNLLTAIAHMKGIREKLKRKMANNPTNNRIKQSDQIYLEDLDATFNLRVRTGCITNIMHLDPIN